MNSVVKTLNFMSNFSFPNFSVSRLRRLRKTSGLREMFRETVLTKSVLFSFCSGRREFQKEISSMPDMFQMSVDNILRECEDF